MTNELLTALRGLRAQYGYSDFDAAIRMMNRERLQTDKREKRKHLTPKEVQRLFDGQSGKCPWCSDALDVPARRNEADHINPNREDFNARNNWQLLHKACNREKSSMTVEEQAKHLHKTFREILLPNEEV